jgi:hypothetical protein
LQGNGEPGATTSPLVFLVKTPGESPADMIFRKLLRYRAKDAKLSRQALGLDEPAFKARLQR